MNISKVTVKDGKTWITLRDNLYSEKVYCVIQIDSEVKWEMPNPTILNLKVSKDE